MRIEIKKYGLNWSYVIYSNNEQICCGGGYFTKGHAIGASFDVAMTYANILFEAKFISQTPNTFVYSVSEPLRNEFDRAITYGTKLAKERRKKPKEEEHDFGNGPVKAHQHKKGGGWVADTAHVSDHVFIGPDAKVYDFARVTKFARICDHARVYDHASVYGHAVISGDARVYGHSYVRDCARVRDNAKVFEDARVYDSALIENAAQIYGHAEVFGYARVLDQARVFDFARIYGCALVFNCAQIFGHAFVHGNALVYNAAKVCATMCNNARAYNSVVVEKTMHGDQNAC